MNDINLIQIDVKTKLTPHYGALAERYAWWILEAICKSTRPTLIAQKRSLNTQETKLLELWLTKLIREQMPLQYLIGTVQFASIDIIVKPPILIPRPETEEWTCMLQNLLKQYQTQPLSILDMCTGSGCVALALAARLPHATVHAVDISASALDLARKNAIHNSIDNVQFFQSDLFTKLDPRHRYDLIVANPPYASAVEWETLEKNVTAWEDKQAIVAQKNGLALLSNIISDATHFLKKDSILAQNSMIQIILEIGATQGSSVSNLMIKHGFIPTLHQDLFGKDRYVTGSVRSMQCLEEKK